MGLIDEIAHAVDPGGWSSRRRSKEQQVWFLERFGADVNLGNIAPDDVLSLETLRLGLRSDTDGRSTVTILLARHGETDDNIPPIRIQGRRDTPLNDTRPRAGRASWPSGSARRGHRLAVVAADCRARARRRRSSARDSAWSRASTTALRGGRSRASWRAATVRRRRARGSGAVRGMAPRRRARSASPGASRCASSRTACSPRSPTSGRAGPLPALVVCHGGSIRVVRCSEDPRGLDAFHDWEVPNVGGGAAVIARSPSVAFAVLVVATLGAFFVTQRLKQTPRLVADAERDQGLLAERSPYRKRRDPVPPQAHRRRQRLDPRRGRRRRAPARAQPPRTARARPSSCSGTGATTRERSCPTASYRVRVGLRRQGRSVTLPDEVRIDAHAAGARGDGREAGGDRRPG